MESEWLSINDKLCKTHQIYKFQHKTMNILSINLWDQSNIAGPHEPSLDVIDNDGPWVRSTFKIISYNVPSIEDNQSLKINAYKNIFLYLNGQNVYIINRRIFLVTMTILDGE
jgi:hypothetical protein